MDKKDWTKFWYNDQLDIRFLRAHYVQHAFPRHSHDYYVITVILRGYLSYFNTGQKYLTPPDSILLINPETVHSGEPVDPAGYEMVSFYPTVSHMESAVYDITGQHQTVPFFRKAKVDDPWLVNSLLALHYTLTQEATPLEYESRFIWTLAELIRKYADIRLQERPVGQERKAVRQARRFIEDAFADGINLSQLAEHVSLSPYYLLRVFRSEVGMPPHTYLETVRIRQVQRLIEAGKPMADIAAEVGFSSQSHLINRFKQIIGVTPGQYAQ